MPTAVARQTAAVTQVKVERDPLTNARPSFGTVASEDTMARITLEVSENLPIGSDVDSPVVATDADNDSLVYTLTR